MSLMVIGINLLQEVWICLRHLWLLFWMLIKRLLRSERSLIKRSAELRNVNGRVIMYADTITNSMEAAISETNRRRQLQMEHNRKHGITPETIKKEITDIVQAVRAAEKEADYQLEAELDQKTIKDIVGYIKDLEKQMFQAANELEFELAPNCEIKLKNYGRKRGYLIEYR